MHNMKILSSMISIFREKYRPLELTEVIGNTAVVSSLTLCLNSGNLPHMLFHGPPGSGKTTTARALARKLYGKFYSSSVLELNASDERGIDTVREGIKQFATTLSFANNKKLVILDEADSMSRDAQNAMRRVIEDFSGNVRFCLIANFSSRIVPAIQSRCTKYRFSPVKPTEILPRIQEICRNENIKVTEDGLLALVDIFSGDVRKLVNDIEGLNRGFGEINGENVYLMGGVVQISVFEEFFKFMCEKSFNEIKARAVTLKKDFSVDCESLISNLGDILAKSKLKNKMEMLKAISEIQYRLSLGCSEDIQLNGLIGIFVLHR